jgi:hypothetical protein
VDARQNFDLLKAGMEAGKMKAAKESIAFITNGRIAIKSDDNMINQNVAFIRPKPQQVTYLFSITINIP